MAFDGGRLTSARRRRRGAGLSQAAQFAKGKPEVISLAFDDPVSDMGSVWIKSVATPSLDFNSSASAAILAKFTGWSATSPMTVRGRDGTLKYAPHNLFLNSDAPATQSITTVVGLKYKVFLTGSGSIALSGAGSGTVTDGSPVEITASTTSLTCTVSGSPTTAQVVNSPCHEGYVSAAGSAKFSIPTTYDTSGNKLGFLSWEARTNAAWWSRDLTQSAWTKTNCTAAKTATGTDGEANSASTLTASAGNATCLQSITAVSAQRVSSCSIKRRTGTGTIEMTQDNGTTWTPITVTSAWTPVEIPAATVTNPIVGFRIVTSGDAIDVDHVQCEVGAKASPPIITAGAAVTRAATSLPISDSLYNWSGTTGTYVIWATLRESPVTLSGHLLNHGNDGRMYVSLGTSTVVLADGTTFPITANSYTADARSKIAGAWGSNLSVCLNGGTVTNQVFDGAFGSGSLLYVGSGIGTSHINGIVHRFKYYPEDTADADLQAKTA